MYHVNQRDEPFISTSGVSYCKAVEMKVIWLLYSLECISFPESKKKEKPFATQLTVQH